MSRLVYVFLLLSLHACNARHLRATDKKTDTKFQLMDKDLVQGIHETKLRDTLGASGFANTLMEKDSRRFLNENDNKVLRYAQREVATKDSEEATKSKGGRKARSTMGTVPEEAKEAVNSKENNVVEDVVVMDYAQPHRKPPIHNRRL